MTQISFAIRNEFGGVLEPYCKTGLSLDDFLSHMVYLTLIGWIHGQISNDTCTVN